MSAYLVVCISRTEDGAACLRGIDIFSEEAPTIIGSQRVACLLKWPGDTYAEARKGLLAHLEKTAPWLLPEKNGGRE